MHSNELIATARALAAPGKGLLAADESFPTIQKRFDMIGLASTEENRRDYRELLFTTPGVSKYLSGVILFDETMRQQAHDGTPLPEVLRRQGMIPGIKVDEGAVPLAHFPDEKITEGLDGLRQRLEDYRQLGARFTKWRAVIAIAPNLPTHTCLASNAELLARFATLSQEAGLVPIVEPEVLMNGDHSLERCAKVTEETLVAVFHALAAHQVELEGMLLKPNMVLPGAKAAQQAGVDEVAAATLRVLCRTVPAAVPGIVFLSGGQEPVTATRHLNAINQLDAAPWQLSFSYGRALQTPPLLAWRGQPANVPAAQRVFYQRAYYNSLACAGKYAKAMEQEAA